MELKNRSGPTDHPQEKPINPRRLSRTAKSNTATVVPIYQLGIIFFKRVKSVPKVAFIEGDCGFCQKHAVFILKTSFLMMFLLIFDVFSNCRDIGFTHGKSSTARLPCKTGERFALRLDPFRRSFLYVFHCGTDGVGAA